MGEFVVCTTVTGAEVHYLLSNGSYFAQGLYSPLVDRQRVGLRTHIYSKCTREMFLNLTKVHAHNLFQCVPKVFSVMS